DHLARALLALAIVPVHVRHRPEDREPHALGDLIGVVHVAVAVVEDHGPGHPQAETAYQRQDDEDRPGAPAGRLGHHGAGQHAHPPARESPVARALPPPPPDAAPPGRRRCSARATCAGPPASPIGRAAPAPAPWSAAPSRSSPAHPPPARTPGAAPAHARSSRGRAGPPRGSPSRRAVRRTWDPAGTACWE